MPEHVLGRLRQVVDGDHVRRPLAAPERLGIVRVDEVEDAGGDRIGALDELVAAPQPLVPQRLLEPGQGRVVSGAPKGDVAHPATSTI